MAVIACPSCKKKISDKASACSHCNMVLGEVDAAALALMKKEQQIKTSQQLMNHSFIAMLLFCGGFLSLYWNNAQPDSWQYITAFTSTVLGFVLYIVTRIRLIIVKRH